MKFTGIAKQVTVMRRNFPDGKGGTFNLRLGKSITQSQHAAIGVWNVIEEWALGYRDPASRDLEYWDLLQYHWINNGATKICVSVDTEEELLAIRDKVKSAGLPFYLVKDAAATELKEPAFTCITIGPCDEQDINPITGNLKLL